MYEELGNPSSLGTTDSAVTGTQAAVSSAASAAVSQAASDYYHSTMGSISSWSLIDWTTFMSSD